MGSRFPAGEAAANQVSIGFSGSGKGSLLQAFLKWAVQESNLQPWD